MLLLRWGHYIIILRVIIQKGRLAEIGQQQRRVVAQGPEKGVRLVLQPTFLLHAGACAVALVQGEVELAHVLVAVAHALGGCALLVQVFAPDFFGVGYVFA